MTSRSPGSTPSGSSCSTKGRWWRRGRPRKSSPRRTSRLTTAPRSEWWRTWPASSSCRFATARLRRGAPRLLCATDCLIRPCPTKSLEVVAHVSPCRLARRGRNLEVVRSRARPRGRQPRRAAARADRARRSQRGGQVDSAPPARGARGARRGPHPPHAALACRRLPRAGAERLRPSAFGRPGDARRARRGVPRRLRRPPARRADERPRLRRSRLARALPRVAFRLDRGRLPRPCLPRPRRHAHRGARRVDARHDRVHRRLERLRGRAPAHRGAAAPHGGVGAPRLRPGPQEEEVEGREADVRREAGPRRDRGEALRAVGAPPLARAGGPQWGDGRTPRGRRRRARLVPARAARSRGGLGRPHCDRRPERERQDDPARCAAGPAAARGRHPLARPRRRLGRARAGPRNAHRPADLARGVPRLRGGNRADAAREVRARRRRRPARGGLAFAGRAHARRSRPAHRTGRQLSRPRRADEPSRRRGDRGVGTRARRVRRHRDPRHPRPPLPGGLRARPYHRVVTATATASILTIGNELVSGDVPNTNASWLARRLAPLGVAVRLMAALPDEIDTIADFVRTEAPRVDFFLVTGGLGGTPDDMTREAIAAAFGIEQVEVPELAADLRSRFRRSPEYAARWALLPRGSRQLANPHGGAPGFAIENVYVLPGLPSEMEAMFASIEEEFRRGTPIESWRRVYRTYESVISASLAEAGERWPGVLVGSYPSFGAGGFTVEVVLKSSDVVALAAASAWLESAIEESGGR